MLGIRLFLLWGLCSWLSVGLAFPKEVTVSSLSELKHAIRQNGAGTTFKVLPGVYQGSIFLNNYHGSIDRPILIEGSDPTDPPVFSSSGVGLSLRCCSYIKLKDLILIGASSCGINISEGDRKEASHHIILENIHILDTQGTGNQDAIRMLGVNCFIIRGCLIEGWGGSAIEMVGCQNGVVEKSVFSGKAGFPSRNAVQIKGGSHAVLLQECLFHAARVRSVQIGGVTDKRFFRPEIRNYEAKNVSIAGSVFIGGESQITWVTAQDSHVHHNLFYYPEKWLGRIQQETKDPQFKSCQRGLFERNVMVTDPRVKVFFNVSQGTEPESFIFRENLWFRPDGDNRPNLPAFETDGIYDVDPMILAGNDGRLQINSADARLKQIGPDAYKPWTVGSDFSDVFVPRVKIPEVKYSTLDWIEALIK